MLKKDPCFFQGVFAFRLHSTSILKVLSANQKHKQTLTKQLSFPLWHGLAFEVVAMSKHEKTNK